MSSPQIFTDCTLAPMPETEPGKYWQTGALVIDQGKIAYVGDEAGIPAPYAQAERTSLSGRLVTPGLIDCHTHLVYAGSRAREFEMRQTGASYEEIMQAGGGIFSTVEATRAASHEDLLASALARLDRLIAEGATTVEIKSGYGLDTDTELRMLRVAREIEQHRDIRVRTTFLGAHAYPKGMEADDYLDQICLPALDQAAAEGLVDAVDGFCENVAFDAGQMERVFNHAAKLGLQVKLHAEQLSDSRGAILASRFNALSADHLEYLCEEGIDAMAKSGTVAVILPAAFYMLKETRKPPIAQLREAGVAMALATDSNPGSSPMTSLLLTMNMGAVLFGLSPQECLRGVTQNGAHALGLSNTGQIRQGLRADLCIWDVTDPAELTYRMGDAPLHQRIFGGKPC